MMWKNEERNYQSFWKRWGGKALDYEVIERPNEVRMRSAKQNQDCVADLHIAKWYGTRKAERFFKERGIKFQFVDLKEKGLSKGEFNSVKQAVGGMDKLIDENAKDKDTLTLIKYIADEDKEEKILENQQILVQPIVRNGKKATVGYQPEVWKEWD